MPRVSRRAAEGIVNLSGRGMLVVSVARQLGLGNSSARLLCCPAQAERGRKGRLRSAKLTMRLSGMSPGNPAIEALRKIPVAPGIHAYSIIPTLQDGPLETRNDGVVEYKSAHIDGVESQLVIEHSEHSTQGNPLTVREVRRILLLHLAEACPRYCTPITDRPPVAAGPTGKVQ